MGMGWAKELETSPKYYGFLFRTCKTKVQMLWQIHAQTIPLLQLIWGRHWSWVKAGE